jgi:hypothetical protein
LHVKRNSAAVAGAAAECNVNVHCNAVVSGKSLPGVRSCSAFEMPWNVTCRPRGHSTILIRRLYFDDGELVAPVSSGQRTRRVVLPAMSTSTRPGRLEISGKDSCLNAPLAEVTARGPVLGPGMKTPRQIVTEWLSRGRALGAYFRGTRCDTDTLLLYLFQVAARPRF